MKFANKLMIFIYCIICIEIPLNLSANSLFLPLIKKNSNNNYYQPQFLDDWYLRSTYSTNPDYIKGKVRYLNNYFVKNSQHSILSSSDSMNWILKSPYKNSLSSGFILSICYDKGYYYALGSDNVIYISNSPVGEWNIKWSLPSDLALQDIAVANNTIVVTGSGGTMYASSNGSTWTNLSIVTSDNFSGTVYANGVFVTILGNGHIYTSTTGFSWANVATLFGLNALKYTNNFFIAFKSNEISNSLSYSISYDGYHWSAAKSSIIEPWDDNDGRKVTDIAYGANKFVITTYKIYSYNGSTYRPGAIYTSTDLANFKYCYTAPDAKTGITGHYIPAYQSVDFGKDGFVALDNNGNITISTDGCNWREITYVLPHKFISSTYNNGIHYIGTDSPGLVLKFNDNLIWEPFSLGKGVDIRGILFGNGVFIIYSENNEIFRSIDGKVWSMTIQSDISSVNSITFGNNIYVLSGSSGIFTSVDGTFWQKSNISLAEIVFGNGKFIGESQGTTKAIYSSINGKDWGKISDGGFPGTGGKITYGKGYYLTSDSNGSIYRSTNGTSWGKINNSSGFPCNYISDIAFGNNIFIGIGNQHLCSSNDGANWTSRLRIPPASDMNGGFDKLLFNGKSFFIIGGDRMMIQSAW
jgi:hypothetical protein